MSSQLTVEESKTLLALCRAGKLYEIERWITSGKSICTPAFDQEVASTSGRRYWFPQPR